MTPHEFQDKRYETTDPVTPAPDVVKVDWNDEGYLIAPHYRGDERVIIPFFADGPVLTREQFEELVTLGRRFYESHSDFWVSAFNMDMLSDRAYEQIRERMEQSPNRQFEPGFVYLLQGGPFFKIGAAKVVDRRVKQLAIKLPFDVSLIHSVESDDVYACERYFHEVFARSRLNGEWFDLDEFSVLWMKAIPQLNFHDW